MRKGIVQRRTLSAIALALVAAAVLIIYIGPAFAWGFVSRHCYHFRAFNNTGVAVNDAHLWATGSNAPPAWQAPRLVFAWSSLWPFTGTQTILNWRRVDFSGGLVPAGTLGWFNIDFVMSSPQVSPSITTAWFRWTVGGVGVGSWRWLGWRIGSPPALYNPSTRPDGTPNVLPLIVRDIQFAVSPEPIPNDETTLDNPVVVSLFASSLDPVRPGPTNIVPGTYLEFTDLDPSITQPVAGGSTVLVTGTVEDEVGNAQAFVVQFIATPSVPAVSNLGSVILVSILLFTGAWLVWRQRMRLAR